MQGRLQHLHDAEFCVIKQVQRVLKSARERHHVPALHAFLKPASLLSMDLYISHCAFFWHTNTAHFYQEELILSTFFSKARFHDNVIKILLLQLFCITTETDMIYQGSFNPLKI